MGLFGLSMDVYGFHMGLRVVFGVEEIFIWGRGACSLWGMDICGDGEILRVLLSWSGFLALIC